jgi:hypothetical protein
MSRTALSPVSPVFLALAVPACFMEPAEPGDAAPAEITRTESCAATACDAYTERCLETNSALRSDCIVSCASAGFTDCGFCFDGNPSDHCYACDEEERATCVNIGFEFTLGRRNRDVGRACRAYVAHTTGCGITWGTPDPCAIFERTERAEMVPLYECLTATPCGAEPTCADPAPRGLTESIVQRMAECDEPLDAWLVEWTRNADGWFRDDVWNAGATCTAEPTCDRAVPCVRAWYAAVVAG